MIETRTSICRNCLAFCPILVRLEEGRPIQVVGDPEAAPFEGYSCPKGRILPEQLADPARLLHSMKRNADGRHAPIGSSQAVAEVAAAISEIVARHGPQSVALYIGTGSQQHTFGPKAGAALLKALGSPMVFSAATIDKPAEKTSIALHGNWHAGGQAFEESDTWMLVGANPVLAKSNGVPYNNPARRLKNATNRGMKLIVLDPRRTETARHAHVHLQLRPGEDPTLLAGLIRIIIAEGLYDRAFVAENAEGLAQLTAAVETFTPDYVAERAGISVDDLFAAARTFAGGKRGGVVCATGASFSLRSDLTFYLALCLNTLCGRWARAGDRAVYPNVLLPAFTPRAQPQKPYSPMGSRQFRTFGLRQNASGLPTIALPGEILMKGPGQIRALICVGGNPVSAWPDQRNTEAAMQALDLLVTLDTHVSATGRYAHYIIAPPMPLESPGLTLNVENRKYLGAYRGYQIPWAQYCGPAVAVPAGSDLMEEHEFFFRLAAQLDLEMELTLPNGLGEFVESEPIRMRFARGEIPTLDQLFELATTRARVPLSEVKRYPHGHLFDLDVRIEPRDPSCTDMLQIGAPKMMAELAKVRAEGDAAASDSGAFPFLLICRRTNSFMNSMGVDLPGLHRGKPYNPLFMHPDDMEAAGLADAMLVSVSSRHGAIEGIVQGDATLRRGTCAMSHGFGVTADGDAPNPKIHGSNVNQLLSAADHDPMCGMPRLSAVPVAVEAQARPRLNPDLAGVDAGGDRAREP